MGSSSSIWDYRKDGNNYIHMDGTVFCTGIKYNSNEQKWSLGFYILAQKIVFFDFSRVQIFWYTNVIHSKIFLKCTKS